MNMKTKVVGLTLPDALVAVIDRAAARTLMTRAGYIRDAVLDRLRREGLVKVTRDADGSVYDLELDAVLG